MGNPLCVNILTFASNALDTARPKSCSQTCKPPSQFPCPNSAPLNDHRWCMCIRILESFRLFFRKGQVIETFCGEGIYQPVIDLAIEKLRAGAWVRCVLSVSLLRTTQILIPYLWQIHLFGKGKVCQSDTYKVDPQSGIARLQRFRWGMFAKFIFFPFRTAATTVIYLIPVQLPFHFCTFTVAVF